MRTTDDSSTVLAYPKPAQLSHTYKWNHPNQCSISSAGGRVILVLDSTNDRKAAYTMEKKTKQVVISAHNYTIICCVFFFYAIVTVSKCAPHFPRAENTSWMGCCAWTLPQSIVQSLIAPTLQLSSPFQHNSIAAPGASCHPELSFVLLLWHLLDWMLVLCHCRVSPSSSPLIIFLNDGYTLWTISTFLSVTMNDISSISEGQCWFDVNVFMVWKCPAWQVSPLLDDSSVPCMWPPPVSQDGSSVVCVQAVALACCGVFIQV